MTSPQVDTLVEQILEALPGHGQLDKAVDRVRQRLDRLWPGMSTSLSAELDEARRIVERQFDEIEILHTHSIIRKRPQWYFGPKPRDFHWPALRAYLCNEKGWPEADVAGIDEASNEVVSLLENPRDPERAQFRCRGLVVGHVQSGKTANMTAVIAKALDAGYDTVIVLAGLTNKLRHQTQVRMYDDLVRRNPLNWQVLTPNDEDRDFRAPPEGGFLSHSDKAQLAVIKKNVSPLRELAKAIRRTYPAVLGQLRILVIDDECDQASVNSARGELDMTAINERIREILAALPAVTYVGYTATPFANVLINPYKVDGVELDDLYPSDFITALPTPTRYFGTERLFGKVPEDPSDPLPEEEGLDMIREVPEEDAALLQPASRRMMAEFEPDAPDSLEDAILYFLGACAARRARGHSNKHMTMLVHTSAYVVMHERVQRVVSEWIAAHRDAICTAGSDIANRLVSIWQKEAGHLPAEITSARAIAASELFDHLPDVLGSLEFPIENGSSEDRINYSDPAKTYIVVGGSILARGLTLEGLMVSYFLRTANQYDTLLQMGRWFGYRPGYEDLPRIWMPDDLRVRFRALSGIEQEIREDIDRYRTMELTPMDIAVRIRSIPGMAITAAAKMRAARDCAVSYWGTHRQTFRFAHKNLDILKDNWSAAGDLVTELDRLGLRDPDAALAGRKLWKGVSKTSVRRFLQRFQFESTHADLQDEMLLPFIDQNDQRLQFWNVGIVEAAGGEASEIELGSAGSVKTVRRARLDDGGNVADIKALMSKRDVTFDVAGEIDASGDWDALKDARRQSVGSVPLLLIYPINKVSDPAPHPKSKRVSLHAERDVIGLGIVFPGDKAEAGRSVAVELRPLSAEEVAAIDEEEAAQAEAAGV